jgi:uncharacterized protein
MTTKAGNLFSFEVKAADAETRTFEGLSSTWELDLGGDVIHKGAFSRTIDHWRSSSKIIPLLDQHQYGSVRSAVGKLIDAKELDDGLWTKWEVIDTPDGHEVWTRIKGGFVDGLSIGYRVIGEAPIENGVRHIKELAWEETSLVLWPMNPGARVQAVKAALEGMTDEERKELGVLTEDPAPAAIADPEPEGLTPDDPERLALEAAIRDVLIRSLASGTAGS